MVSRIDALNKRQHRVYCKHQRMLKSETSFISNSGASSVREKEIKRRRLWCSINSFTWWFTKKTIPIWSLHRMGWLVQCEVFRRTKVVGTSFLSNCHDDLLGLGSCTIYNFTRNDFFPRGENSVLHISRCNRLMSSTSSRTNRCNCKADQANLIKKSTSLRSSCM
jgi:hypothetical protein